MSIPIRCAGCRSSFDVPDDLAGKTIRCTACKAEMTVPEELPAVVVEDEAPGQTGGAAKKPFGSGAQATTKAAATPPPSAKTSPNGKVPPKPPAKSAAKAVVAEEEDDEKTAKSKPSKSADKKAAAKRRRDDDDDEDDEDEKPTRKKGKKKAGGSGSMVPIIAGGGVALVAIVGLCIFLLSGGKDDKKPSDSASNAGGTNGSAMPAAATPASATPAGAGAPSGPGGMPTGANGMPPSAGGMPTGANGMPPVIADPNPPMGMIPTGMPPANPNPPGMVPGAVIPPGMVPGAVIPPGMVPLPGAPNNPPGALPGIPGQPNPMGGQPIPGQPPVPMGKPANTDGNMKAKLDPFLAASFDLGKEEVITLETRPSPRGLAGTLHRYSYPKFSSTASYKMAHIGFRCALDSKAEVLYVAYSTSATTFHGQPADRLSGVGSVAVYDLKQIRDGKAADGKPLADGGDVKPVATINLASRIHGLELSEDGKSLYVLVTPPGKKAALVLIDTASRKESKRTVKEFEEPVLDLVKAANGKTLLVIEGVSKAGSSAVVPFDPVNWTRLKPTTFRNAAVLDVAPMSDGSMIVSTLPLNQVGPGNGPGNANPGGMPPGALPPVGMPPVGMPPGALPPGGVGLPDGMGMPPGGIGGQPPPQPKQPRMNFRLFLIGSDGVEQGEMDLGAARHLTNGGYIEFDPANKKLFASSYHAPGLDVYDVTDPNSASGVKLKTSILTARRDQFSGHFFVTPDGAFLVFQQGAVIDTANVGGELGTFPPGGIAPAPGLPGMPALPGMPPMPGVIPPAPGMPPMPGMPPAGPALPPGMPPAPAKPAP